MKRPAVIIGATILGALALIFYLQQLPPEGVEPKGDEMTLAWVSLAIAILSLLTAVVGLIQKVVELRHAKKS